MPHPLPETPRARLVVVEGALELASESGPDVLRPGWTVAFAPSISAADGSEPSGAPAILLVRFSSSGPEIGERLAGPTERAALRGRCFVATIEAGDGAAALVAYAHGAALVVERGLDPAVLGAHLQHLAESSEHVAELERRRTHLELMQTHSRVGFWELEPEARTVWCSDVAAQMLALDDAFETRSLESWLESIPTDSRGGMSEWLDVLLKGLSAPPFEHTMIDAFGAPFRVRHVARPTIDESGRCQRVVVMVEEVRARAQQDGASAAPRESTGPMLDSSHFLHGVERAIRSAGRSGHHVAVLYLDVHRIHSLTANNLSSNASEMLLAAIADRVRDGIRGTDALGLRNTAETGVVIARWGGDHFTVLLPDLLRIHDAAKVAVRVLERLSQPFEVAGCELCVPASIGIAGFPTDHHSAEELVRRAETASYCARQDGHAAMKFYSAALDSKAFERLTLETSLRRALERRELTVYYQPRIDIRTERIVGFEALLRWKHPDLGFVSPAQFIPLAEETGLIVPIGEWVLRESCRQNREWQDAGLAPVRMAVNLSSIQFSQPTLQEIVRAALDDSKLAATWLELELTESTVMRDANSAVATLARLKSAGVHLSIDDFGTGYSSLAYLKRFPIDALKIDQSFIRDSMTDPDDSAIVTSIILMARSLKLGVVAEGVETESQLSFLRVLQCDEAQGYLFSPPVPAEKARALLEGGLRRRRVA
ncbi:MAG: bifunctional diguanylate cyclase/phosphodiesterase [Planctomycetes bacterium]|nr:bifunctional diguanylate cyclase/phosphodiesterase [Planctomycetota bacterium]